MEFPYLTLMKKNTEKYKIRLILSCFNEFYEL